MAALPQQLSISLIKNTLGAGTNKLSELCRHVNINIWSSARPYDRRTGNAGPILISRLNVPEFITPEVVPTFGWSAILPVGGADSPFRMGDFVGYNHTAPVPIGVKKRSLNIPAVINPNTEITKFTWDKNNANLILNLTDTTSCFGVYIEGIDPGGVKHRYYFASDNPASSIAWNDRYNRRIFPNIEQWSFTMYFVLVCARKYFSYLLPCPDNLKLRLFPAGVHNGVEYINKAALKFSAWYEYLEITFSVVEKESTDWFCPSDATIDYVVLAYKTDGSFVNLGGENGAEVWGNPRYIQDFKKGLYSYIEIHMREPGSAVYPNLDWSPTINFSGEYRTTGDAGYDKEWIFTFRGGEGDCEVLITALDPRQDRPD